VKPIVIVFLVSAALSGLASSAERPVSTLTVTAADGPARSFAGPKDLQLKFWLQQLALSALYRNEVMSATSEEWERAAKSAPAIHCLYPADSHLALPERQLLTLDEIVLAFPERGYPDFIYVRHGVSYSRLAKYDPWLFWKLKVEVGLADGAPDTIARTLF
jgi:hypothetical protein